MKRKILILADKEIKRLISMPEVLKVVEEAFRLYGRSKVIMPAKIYLDLKKYNGDFRAMPAYIEKMDACGLKWVNVHPDNARFNLPAVMATIILSNPKNGLTLSIMDGTFITNVRTGAAGGVAAKYLAEKASSVVALVGCGNQAETQLLALDEVFKLKKIHVWGG